MSYVKILHVFLVGYKNWRAFIQARGNLLWLTTHFVVCLPYSECFHLLVNNISINDNSVINTVKNKKKLPTFSKKNTTFVATTFLWECYVENILIDHFNIQIY